MSTKWLRWLAARLAVCAPPRRRPAGGQDSRDPARMSFALRWRSPWQGWQGVSWLASTLLAPPFFVIGVLLLINAHSDCPYFWPSTMAVIALTNILAIVDVNQRHHRRPFASRLHVGLRYFGVSLLAGGASFLMLVWGTGILQDVIGPLIPAGSATHAPLPLSTAQWTIAAAVAFCVLSFTHACVLHAWLAFEAPTWYRISRGTMPPADASDDPDTADAALQIRRGRGRP